MDIKQIQELVKLINKSNIGELSIEQKDFKITIKQKEEIVAPLISGSAITPVSAPPAFAPALPQASELKPVAKETPSAKTDNTVAIKSPMIGTFYRQAGPGKPVFASVGDVIEKGQVVCMIEAMKLFNEIESDVSGKIVKVLVEDASPVEFDQPLFLVEV